MVGYFAFLTIFMWK